MKKLLTLAAVTVLAASLSFAQAGAANQTSTKTTSKASIHVQTGPQKGKPGEKVALNPQPLPPGSKVSLNPQPLPPKEVKSVTKGSPENKVAINPQPLPPKVQNSGKKSSNISKVALNPQPLPPGAARNATKQKGKTGTQKSAPSAVKSSAPQK
jgi:hypothetical protein